MKKSLSRAPGRPYNAPAMSFQAARATPRNRPVITLDGPAGAGKTTVAKRLAQALGFRFLDTGSMYRACTWKALEEGVDVRDPAALVDMIRRSRLELDGDRIRIDGRDITEAVRSERITRAAAFLADPPEVRTELVRRQRDFGQAGGLVTEGRDQGSVVFPDAEHKFYLDASIDVRARRRHRELTERGERVDYEEVRRGIAERDEKDRTRSVGALRKPADAVVIDTSSLSIDEVVSNLLARLGTGRAGSNA
ncbi:MAG: (d)CMP kinase [Planctomycetes bacterium]|nr:(d)CMP kinase [Planctomycetota bacterium]